jgi:hypothetical protein
MKLNPGTLMLIINIKIHLMSSIWRVGHQVCQHTKRITGVNMSSSTNSSNKSISSCEDSGRLLGFDSAIQDRNANYITTDQHYKIPYECCFATENISTRLLVRSIIEAIELLKNSEIDSSKLTELKTQIQSLASFCNSKFMNNFPIEIVDTSNDNVDLGISSWYSADLNLSNATKYVVDTFEELDTIIKSDSSTRCIDAILVLIQYVNLVILSRSGQGLMIEEKKLDDCSSSKSNGTSIHLVNGDDFYG